MNLIFNTEMTTLNDIEDGVVRIIRLNSTSQKYLLYVHKFFKHSSTALLLPLGVYPHLLLSQRSRSTIQVSNMRIYAPLNCTVKINERTYIIRRDTDELSSRENTANAYARANTVVRSWW